MRLAGIAIALTVLAEPVAAQSLASFGSQGAFDAITINGLVLPLGDVDRLLAAGVLRLDPATQHFSFGTSVSSERGLARQLSGLNLQNPNAALEVYRSAKVAFPNNAAHELTIPSGFGPAHFANQNGSTVLSASLGGVGRVPYTTSPDGALGLGLSFGNAFNGVGASIMVSFNDLSNLGNRDRISWGFALSHYLHDGLSVAVGGENLLVKVTDGRPSFHVAGSWAFTPRTSALPFNGVATLGLGSGRFATMTQRDVAEGKTGPATAVFGSIAWEVTKSFNIIAEWNGRNLNFGLGYSPPGTAISLKFGVEDVTRYSGDGPLLTGSIGVTLARF